VSCRGGPGGAEPIPRVPGECCPAYLIRSSYPTGIKIPDSTMTALAESGA